MTAKDIISATDAAATWCSLHARRDALACYMLRSVGRFTFEKIAAELELESRRDILHKFNSVSVARLSGDQKVIEAIRMAKRLMSERA